MLIFAGNTFVIVPVDRSALVAATEFLKLGLRRSWIATYILIHCRLYTFKKKYRIRNIGHICSVRLI